MNITQVEFQDNRQKISSLSPLGDKIGFNKEGQRTGFWVVPWEEEEY